MRYALGAFFALCVLLSVSCGARRSILSVQTYAFPESVEFCSGKNPLDTHGFARRVALTFDDGPNPEVTPEILAELRRRQIPAAFFILGRRLETVEARALLASMARDSLFLLGNHSFTHDDMGKLEPEYVVRDAHETRVLLESVGVRSPYYRFPYGSASCEAFAELEQERFVTVGWNVDSFDWCFGAGEGRCVDEQSSAMHAEHRDNFIEHVISSLEQTEGGVLVLHDIHRYTAEHLPELLDAIEARGFSFVRLDDAGVFPELAARVRARR